MTVWKKYFNNFNWMNHKEKLVERPFRAADSCGLACLTYQIKWESGKLSALPSNGVCVLNCWIAIADCITEVAIVRMLCFERKPKVNGKNHVGVPRDEPLINRVCLCWLGWKFVDSVHLCELIPILTNTCTFVCTACCYWISLFCSCTLAHAFFFRYYFFFPFVHLLYFFHCSQSRPLRVWYTTAK